jgi:hypothetical protein
MDAFTVLVVITLVLICMCCVVYLGIQIYHGMTLVIRSVLKEFGDDGVEK